MSQSITSLSPSKLRDLKYGETVTVLYRESDNTEARVLRDGFPKKLAMAFSKKWKDEFPPINKTKTQDLLNLVPPKKTITIVGGNMVIHKHVLAWMVSCCDGKGLKTFSNPRFKAFAYLYYARSCASIVGCEYLESILGKRMETMANNQIHSEDVRMLWMASPPDAEMKRFLAEHIAIRFGTGTLKAKGSYRTLREEVPSFNKAVDDILNAKKARGELSPASLERKKNNSNNKKKPVKTAANKGLKEGGGRVGAGNSEGVSDAKMGGAVQATKVVRRGAKGRPIYAKLDLESVSVTK
ncbi:uncharacterized protein PV06_06878 [Exophiala oligosperma]|uniref:Uncharacterized protein n=1 Tax=Exophiala oligosperma TaxID=215243 RepID=A0A0D2AMW1_9EURO|nr:uncharacterized protein PV06_06878 [Exophiala oligosperma]KIW41306.1 hypothetical protein PV06_06878 [Exophiala oligosperma]